MKINRDMSNKTWKQIDDAAWRIYRRAVLAKDSDNKKDADLIIALLRNVVSEIRVEDDKGSPNAA